MACYSGPKIAKDGLVFHYDIHNFQKSWKGAPATNIIGNGCFSNGTGIENESGSYGNNNIVMISNPGNTPYALRQGPGGGEYEIHPKAGYPASLKANTTYCMSIWVAYTSGWDGNDMTLHSRWYDGAGAQYTTATAGIVYETLSMGLVWKRQYTTFTTPSTVSGTYNWYLGYPTNNTTGYRYITGVQLEEGTFPSPFVNGSRSSTQSIIDITKNQTITATSLTYLPDGSFKFTSANSNAIDVVDPAGLLSPDITHEVWVNASSIGTWNGIVSTMPSWGTGLSLSLGTAQKIAAMVQGAYLSTSWTPSANTWYHIVATHRSLDDYTCLYVNGKLENSFYKAVNYVANTGMSIGCFYTSPKNLFFDGIISQVRTYNRALTADEVQRNFNATRARYGV